MDTNKLEWTKLQARIFRVLCINVSKSLTKREIAKKLKISPTAVGKSLKLLEKQGFAKIVNYNNKVNLSSVDLNRDNQQSIELKRVENLKMIYESEIINFLEENFPGTVLILFGSYSFGEDTFESDIDIAIIGTKQKDLSLEKFNSFFEKEVRINFYKSFKEINANLKNNLLNGIILSGRIEI